MPDVLVLLAIGLTPAHCDGRKRRIRGPQRKQEGFRIGRVVLEAIYRSALYVYGSIDSAISGVNRKRIPLDREVPPSPGLFHFHDVMPRDGPLSRMCLGESNRVAFGHR